jgi:hypothetical protein
MKSKKRLQLKIDKELLRSLSEPDQARIVGGMYETYRCTVYCSDYCSVDCTALTYCDCTTTLPP